MRISGADLSGIYRRAHDIMRNVDGLQPQEAFDELLKYLLLKEKYEESDPDLFQFGIGPDLATAIRARFTEALAGSELAALNIWSDRRIRLSDEALVRLHGLFENVRLTEIDLDVRSAALKEFLTAEIRRGLGIYLTPDDVVRMIVEVVDAPMGARVYDPACGTGTFLIETIKKWNHAPNTYSVVWGTDVNPRMLLLAELNLGHTRGLTFHRKTADALKPSSANEAWPTEGQFDVILTNPPFGVLLDTSSHDLRPYKTCEKSNGRIISRQQSEVVFIERSLRLLRPGGALGIVLPRSVVTNEILADARLAIDSLGYVWAAVVLPPETFRAMGTQTTTVVLFFKRFGTADDRQAHIRIPIVTVTNVGFDYTGRPRLGNELPRVANDIKAAIRDGAAMGLCRVSQPVPLNATLSSLAGVVSGHNDKGDRTRGLRLADIVGVARTGKTPARSAYSDSGLFVVKVGNLTGSGINWLPRERNFVAGKEEAGRRSAAEKLMLRRGDILLTSSAHSPIYIAKKVDIVANIPSWIHGEASFVGELLLLRTLDSVDPFLLLAFLRSAKTMAAIQRMVRGQTAHLHPDDLLELAVPEHLLRPTIEQVKVVENIRTETRLNDELNEITHRQVEQLRVAFSESSEGTSRLGSSPAI